jgi:predicted transcriptional regulator
MKTKMLEQVLARVEHWPAALQDELAEMALEMDSEANAGFYHASEEELAAIDEGVRAADEGQFATEEEVEAVFAKFRGA